MAPLAGIAADGHASRGKNKTRIDFRGVCKDFVGTRAGEILALLGPVEAGQETLDIDRRQLSHKLMADLHRRGEGRRQRIPARAQHLQAVLGLLALRRFVERWFHVATL